MSDNTKFVWGPPGTGKTTFLAKQVAAIVERHDVPLVCSLTKAAAREIASRDLPIARTMVGTLHAHAFRALGTDYEVAEAHIDDWNESHPTLRLDAGSSVKTADDLDDAIADSAPRGGPGDQAYQMLTLLRARMVPREQWPYPVVRFADQWEAWKQDTTRIDFTDMIDLCLRSKCFPQSNPDTIIVDEAQDHSALEMALVAAWGARACNGVILAGDPYQALYAWRGADPTVFHRDNIPVDRRRILHQSYRVPRAVHAVASKWITRLSDYEPLAYEPRDDDGVVEPGPRLDEGGKVVSAVDAALDGGKSVMIAASCAYMLAPVIEALRASGIPFANPWRRKQGRWNPLGSRSGTSLGERLGAFAGCNPAVEWWTWERLAVGIDALGAKGVLQRGAKGRIKEQAANEFVQDLPLTTADVDRLFVPEAKAEIESLLGTFTYGNDRAPLLLWWLKHVHKPRRAQADYLRRIVSRAGIDGLDAEPRCYVGTIHSFKGAEADVVFLSPELSRAGKAAWLDKATGGRDEVRRTMYVGMTRARERLVLLNAATNNCVNWSD